MMLGSALLNVAGLPASRWHACGRSKTSSLCPSSGLAPGTATGARLLQLDIAFPTREWRDVLCGRCVRGAPFDPAGPLPDGRTGTRIPSAPRGGRTAPEADKSPNPYVGSVSKNFHGPSLIAGIDSTPEVEGCSLVPSLVVKVAAIAIGPSFAHSHC